MAGVARTIWRIIWVPLAFLIAASCALVVLVTLGLERATQEVYARGGDPENVAVLLEVAETGLGLIAGLTIVPALLIVIVGEVARLRGVLYYVIGGGVALVSIPLVARFGAGPADMAGLALIPVWQVFATAGFAGGLVYWLLAGRSA